MTTINHRAYHTLRALPKTPKNQSKSKSKSKSKPSLVGNRSISRSRGSFFSNPSASGANWWWSLCCCCCVNANGNSSGMMAIDWNGEHIHRQVIKYCTGISLIGFQLLITFTLLLRISDLKWLRVWRWCRAYALLVTVCYTTGKCAMYGVFIARVKSSHRTFVLHEMDWT